MLTVVLALLAAPSNALASVLQRKANLQQVAAGRSGLAALGGLLRQPLWLGGVAALIVSSLLQAAALSAGALGVVQPLLALELPITLVLASAVFRQRIPARTWLHILAMTAGIALLLFALRPARTSMDPPEGPAWAWAAGLTGAVVVALVAAAYTGAGRRRGALLGTSSGICFALTAAFMAGALADGLSWQVLGRWQTLFVVLTGVVAMMLLQEALRAGSLVVVQPGLTLTDPLVAMVLGALLFGEAIRTGPWLVAEALGALAAAWGALALSRSTAAGLEHATPASPAHRA